MIEKEEFIRVVESAFQFLTGELGFAPPTMSHDKQGVYEYTTVKYQNEHITIKIDVGWHFRDSYLSVGLCPRSGFSIPVHLKSSGHLLHVLDGFSVEGLAEARNLGIKIPHKAGHETLLRIYADIMSRSGRDILKGDFRSFPQIKEAVKRNIVKTDPNWTPQDASPQSSAPKRKPPSVPEKDLPADSISDETKESSVPVSRRGGPAGTPLVAWIIVFGGIVLVATLQFGITFPRDLERHHRDLRLMANGHPMLGRAGEAHAGVSRYGVPSWTEVWVDADPYKGTKFTIQGVLLPGTMVKMRCFEKEVLYTGTDDLRRRLR